MEGLSRIQVSCSFRTSFENRLSQHSLVGMVPIQTAFIGQPHSASLPDCLRSAMTSVDVIPALIRRVRQLFRSCDQFAGGNQVEPLPIVTYFSFEERPPVRLLPGNNTDSRTITRFNPFDGPHGSSSSTFGCHTNRRYREEDRRLQQSMMWQVILRQELILGWF